MGKIQLIAGRGNPFLAQKIARHLKIPLTPVRYETFADGEIYTRIEKKVRDDDVFIIQSLCSPVNENLMELLITIDALKRASAGRINVVTPYLCYCRQDRKATSREPITAKLVADLITRAGADRLLAVDLHADQIQGFYDIPVDHLVGYPLFAEYLQKKNLQNAVIIAPDVGAVKKATKLAQLLHFPLAFADKRRQKHNQSEATFIVGEVNGKTAIILDDMIDTGGTVCSVADILKKKGARKVIICATHALLNDKAIENLMKSAADKVVFLDTVAISKEKQIPKVEVISLALLLAKVIKRIHEGKSLGTLFKWEEKEVAL
jgi:ribose-phosphate pyrophosphokinase